MKPRSVTLLAVILLLPALIFGQKSNSSLLFRTGPVAATPNLTPAFVDSFNRRSAPLEREFVVLQFESLPDEAAKKELALSGIELLDYLPQNAYTATISRKLNGAVLQRARAQTLMVPKGIQKMHPALARSAYPAYSVKVPGTIDAWISFPRTIAPERVTALLKEKNIDIISTGLQHYRVLHVRLATGRLTELADLPLLEYVQPAPPADFPLNFNSRALSRANMLNAPVALGGRGLNGEGVVVGIGDNSDVQAHTDFRGRLINRSAAPPTGHGHHVHGTVAGSGNLNELYRGYAPKATIVSQYFGGIVSNAEAYVQDYGMVVTNNSYGSLLGCENNGIYDLYARILDQQAFDLPHLQQVFASGNSGLDACPPYPPSYGTVLGGYQVAKNVITVGATTDSNMIRPSSSRGPVRDGRLKPEIMAMGTLVASSWPSGYSYSSGTSMAAPAVAGGLVLLYQRYRQLHGGANPKSGLMKALLCNGAADQGTAGPDFTYGYGGMNLLRTVDMLEKNRYFTGNSTQGGTATHTITVPPNTAAVKVMLYWHDPAASVLSSRTLVNDLDLEVVNGASVTRLPGVLDTSAANVALPATTGADHINNMEQVVLSSPASGTYTIQVKGSALAQNTSQEYFVVYDVIPVSLQLTNPAGHEALVPTDIALNMVKISWDAYGNANSTYSLQFSTDDGNTWTSLATGLASDRRIYSWWVPPVVTDKARIRVIQDATGVSSTSPSFVISPVPVLSFAPVQCEGYITLNWSAVPGVTDYEVMQLIGEEMQVVATTAGLTHTFSGLSSDSAYLVTVRPRIHGKAGRRAQAASRIPNTGTCAGSVSNGDLKLNAWVSPFTGRKFTSTALSAATPVRVQVKNLDDVPVTGLEVGYAINDGTWIRETVPVTIPAGAVYIHTFGTTADLSATGTYRMKAFVRNLAPDAVPANDTLVRVVRQLENAPVALTSPFLDDLESAATETYGTDTTGLNGLDRYDFENATPAGRLRTFLNSGIAYSGSRALTLDAAQYFTPGNINYLKGTFNLAVYTAAGNDLRLDFQYNNHGQVPHPQNKVWIRGSDAQSWIEAFDLDSVQNAPGQYKKTASIELSDLLAAGGQTFTPSFGIRWGQYGHLQATDRVTGAGYTFDNIRLYEVFNDLQMLGVDTPISASCGLGAAVPVQVRVRNSHNSALANIPVRYRVNNGAWVSGNIPSIGGNSVLVYTFPTPADLSALGTHVIETVVEYPSDTFRENDTSVVSIVHSPLITSFPYLENFEGGKGHWYGGGKNSTWEFGTPASYKIKGAASGARAWKTRLTGHYNDGEHSYLYSPCFNTAGLTYPKMSFHLALDLEDCGTTLCDAAWVEYTLDGRTWTKLAAPAAGSVNGYNKAADAVWSKTSPWRVTTLSLPSGKERLQLRFVLQSDEAVSAEGIAIDDIHVYDSTMRIYDEVTLTAPLSREVSGSGWTHFTKDHKVVASLQPNGQNLGVTKVGAYLHTGPVRTAANQYYHNRNITIRPSVAAPQDSVSVRFYFTERELDSLFGAKSCAGCAKPAGLNELGVSKYSDLEEFENGTISDNNQGMWDFLPGDKVAKVPFDRGYYAEFRVKSFSEFWLNNGGFTKSRTLPVKLLDFSARKDGGNVVLLWKTDGEADVLRYELELAKSNDAAGTGQFVRVTQLPAAGTATGPREYAFTDDEALKTGVRHYRLKIINTDGSFRYSDTRAVLFSDEISWQVLPNPSSGTFYFVYQLNTGEAMQLRVTDALGRVIWEKGITGNGFVQKQPVELGPGHASGVYLLNVRKEGQQQVFKLYRN